ncbi:unnamed protein product [Hapterophycus canaliculatus]
MSLSPALSRPPQLHGTATGKSGSNSGVGNVRGEGGGADRTIIPLTPGEDGEAGVVTGAVEISGGVGEEQMPAEMSGMLQRYSEMMLRVVQEKIEARISEGSMQRNS